MSQARVLIIKEYEFCPFTVASNDPDGSNVVRKHFKTAREAIQRLIELNLPIVYCDASGGAADDNYEATDIFMISVALNHAEHQRKQQLKGLRQ